jgi:uncharacterized protein (DUF927 family)
MTPDEEDLALQTLLAIRSESVSELDEALLRQCYAIQRKHQFNADRSQSSAAMERLLDEAVNKVTSEASA